MTDKTGSAATPSQPRVAVVAGAAGFVGSHLVDALLTRGVRVVGLDSFTAGRASNLAHLKGNPRFEMVQGDMI